MLCVLFVFVALFGVEAEYECADLVFLPLCICAIRFVHLCGLCQIELSMFLT